MLALRELRVVVVVVVLVLVVVVVVLLLVKTKPLGRSSWTHLSLFYMSDIQEPAQGHLASYALSRIEVFLGEITGRARALGTRSHRRPCQGSMPVLCLSGSSFLYGSRQKSMSVVFI